MAEIKLTLIVARTTEQELAAYKTAQDPAYKEKLAVAYLSKADMGKLEVKEGDLIKVSSPHGSVVVKAAEDPDLSEGLIVLVKGFWANLLVPVSLGSENLLADRGMEVAVEKAEGEAQTPSP
ncbi:MAG: molybdopterin dinucleotide binding domain-containing protein [Candidatus Hecatellaceae archaeon]